MLKTYNDIVGLSNTLGTISRDRWPFNITIAKNMKALDKVIAEYNNMRQEIIDKYAVRDDNGVILGVEKPVQVNEGEEPRMERIVNPQRIDETQWTDRAAFDKELKELNTKQVEFEVFPVDVKKVFLNTQTGKEMTIEEFLDNGMEPGLILYFNEYGFWKGLEI